MTPCTCHHPAAHHSDDGCWTDGCDCREYRTTNGRETMSRDIRIDTDQDRTYCGACYLQKSPGTMHRCDGRGARERREQVEAMQTRAAGLEYVGDYDEEE